MKKWELKKLIREEIQRLDEDGGSIDIIVNEIVSNKKYLYHCTTRQNAINILKHNYFRTSSGIINIKGLSTTSDFKYNWGNCEVKFVLNRDKLSKNYKLVDVDEKLGFDESEIKIVSNDGILNANKYIVDVIYKKGIESIKNSELK